MNNKLNILMNIQKAKELYVIMSKCTRLPFVNCNEDTMDDEVFVFLDEEAGKNYVTFLAEKDELVDLITIQQKQALGFFSSLYTLGVNCVHMDKSGKHEMALQLAEIVRRPEKDQLPEGKERIENPEFHLTAMYYMQKIRKNPKMQMNEELKELQEEMMIHFWEGDVLLVVQEEGKQIPLLRKGEGKPYQPIFSDVPEFQKFCSVNPKVKFRMLKVEAKKVPMILAKEAAGVVVNPFGVNLQLDIARKKE